MASVRRVLSAVAVNSVFLLLLAGLTVQEGEQKLHVGSLNQPRAAQKLHRKAAPLQQWQIPAQNVPVQQVQRVQQQQLPVQGQLRQQVPQGQQAQVQRVQAYNAVPQQNIQQNAAMQPQIPNQPLQPNVPLQQNLAANPPNVLAPLNNAGQQNAPLGQVQSINQQGNPLDLAGGGVGGFAGGLGDGGEDFRDQGQMDLQPLPGKVADINDRNKKLVQKVQNVKNEGRLPEMPKIPPRARNDPQMKVKLDGIPPKLAAPAAANQRSGGKGHMRIADNLACREDVQRLCAHNVRTNNFAILDCLQNDRPKDDDLSPDCHHFLWDYKRNLTKDIRFDQAAYEVCKEPLAKLPECSKLETGQGLVISCLMDHKGNISNQQCHQFLVKMTSIVFSDYHLVENFVKDCTGDIQKFQCGRVSSRDEESQIDHSQGYVINCLQKRIGEKDGLEVRCMKQILRVGELSADDYHEDRALYFACRDDRERFCEKITAGEGKVLKCLVQHKFEHDMSDDCREKLIIRQRLVSQDYKVNYGLAKKCKEDIKHYHCRVDNMPEGKFAKLSFILLCLENAIQKGRQVSGDCQGEMFDMRRQLMSDFQISPEIVLNCRKEIEDLCSGLQKEGRTIHCLMQNGMDDSKTAQNRLSKTCMIAVQSLVKEADAGFDYRMDVALQDACEPVVQTACKDIKPGDAMILSCLMEHLYTPSMVVECEEKLLELQYFISRDWRLDPRMYRKCAKEAERLCNAGPEWNDTNDNLPPGIVFSCLYRHVYRKDETKLSHACAFEVRRVMHQRAVDVRLNPMLEKACLRDLGEYCSENVEKGEVDVFEGATLQIPPDQEMHCLQDNFKNLSKQCSERVGNFTQMSSQDLDLDRIFMMSCAPMIKRYCKDIVDKEEDDGALLQCLIDNKNEHEMNKKCAAGIMHMQLIQLKDYRFSFKFKEACKSDVVKYCRNIKNKADLVNCLSEIVRNDTLMENKHKISKDCRGQLRVELLDRGEDVRLDPKLMQECNRDIQQFCDKEQLGDARILECLKRHKKKLSDGCHVKLFNREREELTDNSVDYGFMRDCKPMVKRFCPQSDPKEVLHCLRKNKNNEFMDERCKKAITQRQIEQAEDYRLDVELQKKCKKDVPKFCRDILAESRSTELEGRVIGCLKAKVGKNRLSPQCEDHIKELMREAAIDYRMDPQLAQGCKEEMTSWCSEEMTNPDTGSVEECLKKKFSEKKITSKMCQTQVLRLLQEGKADIHVDPLLHQSCALDIKHYCAGIPAGEGRQMSCLLEALEDRTVHLQRDCEEKLKSRVEMWEYAAKVCQPNVVMVPVQASMSGTNFLTLVISGAVFIILCCGALAGLGRMPKKGSSQS
ncbi:GLG1 [Branchiostoma lanceolatum]|uniref:GLG1 protein n=1 Tax=Branchiostoma lanceolatum TaxID=7740 RepID=A0A8K0EXY9_BRALA|nr:GLG1 [Branchiostoma lanceolatum]